MPVDVTVFFLNCPAQYRGRLIREYIRYFELSYIIEFTSKLLNIFQYGFSIHLDLN